MKKDTKHKDTVGATSDEKIDRIVTALERIADALEANQPVEDFQREDQDFEEAYTRETEVPTEIKLATAAELAARLIDFAKTEFPDDERIHIRNVSRLYWTSKNVQRYGMPPEIELKMEKAEMLAQKELDKQREIVEKERLEKEKTELPSLVGSCVDWARGHGLKRVTQADVDAFLLEKNLEILPQTKRSLYATANVEIRSKS